METQRQIGRSWWAWILLVPSAAAIGLYLRVWTKAPLMGADSPGYLSAARDLASGGLVGPTFRTPGYPILLLLVGASEQPNRLLFLVQLILQVASVYLACAALREAGASTTLTVAVGVLGLLPPFALRSAFVLTENLAQFCLVLAVYCLQRFLVRGGRGWLALASVAMGYAALTRPTFQLAALALGLLLLVLRARTRCFSFRPGQAALLLSGTIVLVGGYALWNQIRFGTPGTTTTVGYNLADLCPNLYGEIPDPTTRRLLVGARNDAYVNGRAVEWAHFTVHAELLRELGKKPEELEPWLKAQLTQAILAHPIQYLQAVSTSVARFWFPAVGDLPLLREKRFQLCWYALHFLLLGVLAVQVLIFACWFLLASHGVRVNARTDGAWVLWFVCAALIGYNAAISCALEIGEVRFRSATEILLLLAAGAGIVASQGLLRALPSLTLPGRSARVEGK